MTNGQMRLDDKATFFAECKEFGDGESFVLTLESAEEAKSKAQERFFHGPVLKAVARAFKHLGWTKQEAKDYIALQCIPLDIPLPDGTYYRVPGRTSGLPKHEYSDLIEFGIRLAAENGEVVKDADEWRRSQGRAA